MARRRPRGDGQKWRTFIKNHSHELFACDFMTQYTALFTTVYVFVVMDAAHVGRVAREFIEYYNRARPSQGGKRSFRVHAIPDPYPELIALPVLGGAQHDYRLAA